MKNFKSITLGALLMTLSLSAAAAQKQATATTTQQQPSKKIDFAKDVDGLGGNDDLMEMANGLKPESKSRIVQDRIVDRHNRLEFGISYGATMGGTTYLQTQNLGAQIDYHINPHWSLGARYYDYSNSLTPEGQRAFDDARAAYAANGRAMIVDIDNPLDAKMAVINWYPVYGKINFFDAAIAQFDFYLLAGGGQIDLDTGSTGIYTAGLGFGLWMTQHLSARAEIRYQHYQDEITTGPRDINAGVATVGFGFIL